MSYEFKLPELGEQIETGDVVRILVDEGDHVDAEQVVLELETDKAVLEVPCDRAGRVEKIHVSVGDEIPIGATILTLDTDGGEQTDSQKQAETDKEASPSAEAEDQVETKTEPPESDPGDSTLNEYPPLQEQETSNTQPAEKSQESSQGAPKQTQPSAPTESQPQPSAASRVTASPSVRRLAREIGIDITEVQGSGPAGRISEADIKAYARERPAAQSSTPAQPPREPSGPEPLDDAMFSKWGDIRRETMSRVRKTTAKNLAQAWSDIPHVTHFDQADITDIDDQRKKLAKEVEEAGGQLTVTAVVLKIVGLALREFPMFRASVDIADQEIVYKDYVHIGVAVDTDRGLLVPVIRDVDKKDLVELAVELTTISASARTGKLSLEDMQGAVFSISNLGGIGGTNFTPIINPPEVAIMGISRAQLTPVFVRGTFVPRLLMPFSLSYDHRVIDGADAARFCRWIATTIESPLRILLQND